MAFIGNSVQTQGFAPAIDYFSGNASTVTFTLSRPVSSVAQMIVSVANVVQNPASAYTVSGNSITFSSAPPSGTNNIWVEYTSLITTYAAISQSPSVIGDITASGGYFAKGNFNNTYDDGTVIDYVTGNGRITVGSADALTIYNGGTTGRTALLTMNANGAMGVGTSPSYGTAGQILTSQGSSAPPQWQTTSTTSATYLLVAGGGGGGGEINTYAGSGGGGGGGVLTGNAPVAGGVTYTITVGAGGAGGTPSVNPTNATNSVFTAITTQAIAGGYGAGSNSFNGGYYAAGSGGSGGGGLGYTYPTGGSSTSGQGNSGGSSQGGSPYSGAGGGGAGGAGGNATNGSSTGGAGGVGLASSITGSSVYYAGGGGGACGNSGGTAGSGGNGGGGNGGSNTIAAQSGATNQGGGGGGASANNYLTGGNGGSGIVVVSYPNSYKLATATGTYTQTSSSGNYIFTFTGSGTITF